jgi:hypothetical protein
MSFSIDSTLCDVIKPILPLTKVTNTSVSASKKNSTIQISQFNLDQQILFYHQINNQDVKEPVKFAIASERLVALIHGRKTKINLDYDGSALNYSSGKSKGICETIKFEAYERPDIKSDKILTSLVRKYFGLISLKTVVEGTDCFIFIEETPEYTHLIVTDTCGYHAVRIKVKVASKHSTQLTIPLIYVQNAIRILKEDIQICSDDANLYCYTKNEQTTSIIRFRNLLDTSGISSEVIQAAIESEDTFNFETKADAFSSILNDYKVIKDKDKSGSILVKVKDKKLNLRIETRHGYSESSIKIKDAIEEEFELPISLLEDCLRLKEGTVTMGLKKEHNIFFINQSQENLDITYIMSASKMDHSKNKEETTMDYDET